MTGAAYSGDRITTPGMKRKHLFLLALVAVIAGLFAWYQRPAARLRRQVDYWAHHYAWQNEHLTVPENDARKADALRALGPEAITLLRQDLQVRDSPWEWFRFRAAIFAPARLRGAVLPKATGLGRRIAAAYALALLGPEAKAAVPELLTEAGKQPLAPILALAAIGDTRPAVIIALTNLTNSAATATAAAASYALWRLRGRDDGAVALGNLRLADSATMRSFATMPLARELARLGAMARPFVPGLEGAMDSSFPGFASMELMQKVEVARALWLIDGSAGAALQLVTSASHNRNSLFLSTVFQLSEIPGVGQMAKPMVENMKLEGEEARYHSNVLRRIGRALQAATNSPAVNPPGR